MILLYQNDNFVTKRVESSVPCATADIKMPHNAAPAVELPRHRDINRLISSWSPHIPALKDGYLLVTHIAKARVFSAFAQLRMVMRELESALNIEDFTTTELDILSISIQLAKSGRSFSSSDIVAHPMLKKSARATVYRAIISLESRGLLVHTQNGTKQISLNLDAT
jgi:hypothetical protein